MSPVPLLPQPMQTYENVMIPKRGKIHMPHLSSASIPKVFERLPHGRIAPLVDFIRQEQFHFRREHSTTLQFVRVITQLMDDENKHHSL